MSVYFIACGGFIKVGYSADPERRTRMLFKSGSRYSAPRAAFEARGSRELLHTIEGDKGTERALHNALDDYYAGCEWFVDEPELREWIMGLADDDDFYRPREYPALVRPAGPVDVPDDERGGGNYALYLGRARRGAVSA